MSPRLGHGAQHILSAQHHVAKHWGHSCDPFGYLFLRTASFGGQNGCLPVRVQLWRCWIMPAVQPVEQPVQPVEQSAHKHGPGHQSSTPGSPTMDC